MFVIAGVTGHVGSVAAGQLLDRGNKVKVIVRDAGKGTPWAARGAEIAVGSVDDAKFLASALRGANGFFTLLPPPAFHEPDFYIAQRRTADAIAVAVKTSRVPHVVLLSSVGADLPSGNGPIKGLHYLENKLRETDTKLTAVRAGYFQENFTNVLGAAREAGIFPNFTPSETAPMPMIATRDIGGVVAQSLEKPPTASEVVDVHGPEYSVRQVADEVGRALGKPLKVVTIPPAGAVDAMVQAGFPRHFAEVFAEMYAGFATGAIQPKGDRFVQGRTELSEVVRSVLG